PPRSRPESLRSSGAAPTSLATTTTADGQRRETRRSLQGERLTPRNSLALLLQQSAAQHAFRRQSVPAGLTHPLSAQVTRNQAGQLALAVHPLRHRPSSQPISCCANTSNIVAWMVRS